MIPSYALVPVRSIVFVECIGCKVQYTIIQWFILQDLFIGRSLLEGFYTCGLWDKHIVIQVAFIDMPHFSYTKYGNGAYCPYSTQLTSLIEEKKNEPSTDKQETCPRIWGYHIHAHLFQIIKNWQELISGDSLLQGCQFTCRNKTGYKYARSYCQNQCYTCS